MVNWILCETVVERWISKENCNFDSKPGRGRGHGGAKKELSYKTQWASRARFWPKLDAAKRSTWAPRDVFCCYWLITNYKFKFSTPHKKPFKAFLKNKNQYYTIKHYTIFGICILLIMPRVKVNLVVTLELRWKLNNAITLTKTFLSLIF